jgi:glycine oxidase
VIGLSTALELAAVGVRAHIIGVRRDGSASGAAAGLLAPSIGRLDPLVRELFDASLARFPAFVDRLRSFDRDLTLIEGLLQVASAPPGAGPEPSAARLDAASLARIEPMILAPHGGWFHRSDGAIDNVRLMGALWGAVAGTREITATRDDPAVGIAFGSSSVQVDTRSGQRIDGSNVVLAAGAWSREIAGLPRTLPIAPLKGQMLALVASQLRHAVASDAVYLVPRGDEVVVGATVEHAGFDTSLNADAIEQLRLAAVVLCPTLADAPVARRWAGIRPATPDMLPILGLDPDQPSLIYACGHSKNGILLAPETAIVTARLAQGLPAGRDLSRYSVARFNSQ